MMTIKQTLKHVSGNFKGVAMAGLVASTYLVAQPALSDDHAFSGAFCKPANLTQAQNHGFGWSQLGVKNNGSVGPFYVVCPLHQTYADTYTRVRVGGTFPISGGTINCAYRRQNWTTGAFNAALVTINSIGPIGNSPITAIPPTNAGAYTNATIVCALDPGEGLHWIGFFD